MTDVPTPESPEPQDPRKGPLSFLSGALTAGLLAWLALGLSRRMVVYFAVHPPHYSQVFHLQIDQKIYLYLL
jgi:hypothetical protein